MHAFETLIDAQKRQVYDRIRRKEKQRSKMEGNVKTKASKARPRPDERPEEDVKESEMGREGLDDQLRRLQKLLLLPRKCLVVELLSPASRATSSRKCGRRVRSYPNVPQPYVAFRHGSGCIEREVSAKCAFGSSLRSHHRLSMKRCAGWIVVVVA